MNILDYKAVYDISLILGEGSATYPGDSPYSRHIDSSIAAGADYNLSTLKLSAHAGTHIDSPAHFIEDAKTLDQYPINGFIRQARVVFVKDGESVKPQDFEDINLKKGDAVLFKTQNSLCGLSSNSLFSEEFVYLSQEAAELCVDMGLSLVGIDYISIDRYGDDTEPVHLMLLKNDVLILEGIDLKDVPPGRYVLIVLPLRIKGGEAAPARAILLR